MVTLSGTCRRPGPTGLEPCALGTRVMALRCSDRSCESLEQVGETTADANGQYRLTLDAAQVEGRRLIVTATITGGASAGLRAPGRGAGSETTYRVLVFDFGPVGMVSGANIDPVSEAGVELLEQGGLENYTDSRVEGVLETVQAANASTDFAGLSPEGAVDRARMMAADAPPVQARLACGGDCDLGGGTSINELILAVNVSLGSRPVTVCEAADSDANTMVSINELIEAVNTALNGCVRDATLAVPGGGV